ncbi:hypothetical protein O3S81_08320 [Agrobacterium sp. SOY23]|uniref:hypothetical protein n=1 Tax=Agrobacterium sp. SOY23 TaxID=3014555 RepID=UPI0022AF329B|nr:hypothetical protein [Agrobacterium sp. SOY23]MCZ4429701.1 hypothetical protein [Agrobacterium sp. SOY23]
MTHVQPERLPLVLEWNQKVISIPSSASIIIDRIGSTPPDIYGNGRDSRVTPCEVTSQTRERFETAMICVQRDAPVQHHMRFRLGSEIAEVRESQLALPRVVREASSRAEEMRMGFSPTLIEMPDGKRLVMNGMTSFMANKGYAASDARVVSDSFLGESQLPDFIAIPSDIIYFIIDGDPAWTNKYSNDAKSALPPKGWIRRLFAR